MTEDIIASHLKSQRERSEPRPNRLMDKREGAPDYSRGRAAEREHAEHECKGRSRTARRDQREADHGLRRHEKPLDREKDNPERDNPS
jgi:hypothetical protein